MDQYNQSFKNMQMQNPNYHDFIVKKQDENKTYGSIEKRLIIDSRDRNYKLFPKAGNYVVNLNDQYKNVTSIELVRYSIPQSGYLINNTNNILIIAETGINVISDSGLLPEKELKDNGTEQIITLCPGDYKVVELINYIQSKLCANKKLKSNYSVSVNTKTGKICIKSDLRNGGFHLKFCGETELDNNNGFKRLYQHNSIGKILGFNPRDHLFSCGNIIGVQDITNNLIKEMLYKNLKAFCIHATIPVINDINFLAIHGNNTKFKCEFNCYDFIRIVDSDTKNTIRFLILNVGSDNTMYVIGHTEKTYTSPESFTPKLEKNSIKNCMCCDLEDNPNYEYWEKESSLPQTGHLINLRNCCANYNGNICATFNFDRTMNAQFIYTFFTFGKCTVIYKSTHCAENKYDLFYDKYLVLDIPELHRLDSNSTPLIDSFTIIPLTNCPNSNLILDKSHSPLSPEIKYFNPPMGKLQKFTIKFLTYNGKEYDFNGREHYLDLRINMLNQQSKYLNL